jgi:hypothetical protein
METQRDFRFKKRGCEGEDNGQLAEGSEGGRR